MERETTRVKQREIADTASELRMLEYFMSFPRTSNRALKNGSGVISEPRPHAGKDVSLSSIRECEKNRAKFYALPTCDGSYPFAVFNRFFVWF